MKTYVWSVMLSAGVAAGSAIAQEQPPQPAAPPPAPVVTDQPATSQPSAAAKTNAPSATSKTTTKKVVRTTAPEPVDPVTAGPAAARQNNINVRGKAAIRSEILTRLKKGDRVEVLEIVKQPAKPDEPDKWARIALPTNTAVWIHSDFIDGTNKTVKPRRLNVRSGPSENHSVIGTLTRGATIQEVDHKGDWVQIQPPQGVYGFVAAHLLAPAVAPPLEVAKTDTPPPTPPTETKVETPAPTPTPTDPPPPTPTPATDIATATQPLGGATPAPEPPVEEEEIKRVVSREGIVKRSVSIQAPTWFVLESPDTGRTVNYLHTPSTNVVLRDFFGQRVLVTGEEGLDERWPNTPVINVESIEVVP